MDSDAPKLDVSQVTPHIAFSSEEGKVWLNEQRVILFSQAALGKFRKEVFDTIGKERCKSFFLRLGYNNINHHHKKDRNEKKKTQTNNNNNDHNNIKKKIKEQYEEKDEAT